MAIERYDSSYDTNIHRKYVSESMKVIINELMHRALSHDMSKLTEPEKSCHDKYVPLLKNTTYGTPEYDQVKKQMEDEGLKHHFEVNRHHPEHFPNGISDMTLVDLIEMFVDHYSASLRSNTDYLKGELANRDKYSYPPELMSIFANTYYEYFSKRQ